MLVFLALACGGASPPDARPAAPAAATQKGAEWTVNCHGGADFADVRSAIDAAASGDHVSVAPCSYYGSLHLHGKKLDIEGTAGRDDVVIYASPGTPVLQVDDGEPSGTRIANLTLTGGGGGLEVPAIEVSFASLTLQNVHITGNVGDETLYGRSAHLLIQDSLIEGNSPTTGIVIQERRGETAMKDTTLECGTATVGYQTEHAAALLDGVTFVCPGARSIEIFHSQGRIQRAELTGELYVENETTDSEGTVVKGSVLHDGAEVYLSDLTLENVVSTGPLSASYAKLTVTASVVTGQACAITAGNSTISTSYDVFWKNTANGCGTPDPTTKDGTSTAVDPTFVDATGGDFHLAASSPLVDAGPSTSTKNDPDGSPNDIGAYGGRHSFGGGW